MQAAQPMAGLSRGRFSGGHPEEGLHTGGLAHDFTCRLGVRAIDRTDRVNLRTIDRRIEPGAMMNAREHLVRADHNAYDLLVAFARRRVIRVGGGATGSRPVRAFASWSHGQFLSGEPGRHTAGSRH
jgi:hypothetical protein